MRDDLIKRSDAIKAVADYFDLISYSRRFAESILNKVPSADRPNGEWIDVHANYKYVRACSECGWQHDVVHYGDSFCPHCGAKMKGADDEVTTV